MPEKTGLSNISTAALPGGLLLLTEHLPYLRSVALGLAFRLGGRDDPPGLAGLAHFTEHMVFKGTRLLSAREISYRAESLGAELNAFTDKELTCFYGRFPSDQQVPVAELLSEIVAGPAFDPAEIAKEKEVIGEEIRTAEEDPESKVFNLLFEAFFPDHPMAEPVSGSAESIGRIESPLLSSAFPERYHSGTGIAVAVGDLRAAELGPVLEAKLDHWPRLPGRDRPAATPGAPIIRAHTRKDLSQVYVCLAMPLFPYADPRRHALSVLNTGFGGGLSSRLFQRLREDEALVYSVSSFVELFEDSGLLGIYFVSDRRKLDRCLAALEQEITRLRREKFSAEEFKRALVMTRSSLLLGLESPTSRMVRLARTQHMLGRVVSVDETLERYDRLVLDEVNGLVDEILDVSGFHAGCVGPVTEAELARPLGR